MTPNVHTRRLTVALGCLLALVLTAACDSSDSEGGDPVVREDNPPEGPVPSVGTAGVQDIGTFRAILNAGGVPGPDTLDPGGFFLEHALTLPSPDCGQDVCAHALAAVDTDMLTGQGRTTVLIAMNTPRTPTPTARGPMHIVFAVETSAAMTSAHLDTVRQGLWLTRQQLLPDDRVSLIAYDTAARVLAEDLASDDPQLQTWFDNLRAEGTVNLYDGLRTAYDVAERHATPDLPARVILLNGNAPDSGITQTARLRAMSDAFAARGTDLSIIGLTPNVNDRLLRDLVVSSGASLYTLDSPASLVDVFAQDLSTTLTPLANDVTLTFTSGPSYQLADVFGGASARQLGPSTAQVHLVRLQLAQRSAAPDPSGDAAGRRGGGGFIALRLAPNTGEPGAPLGQLRLDYTTPGTDAPVDQTLDLTTPLRPGVYPPDGHFTSDGARKGFAALNAYAGLKAATAYAETGDIASALGVLDALHKALTAWLSATPDPDIEADLRLVEQLQANLSAAHPSAVPNTANLGDPWSHL